MLGLFPHTLPLRQSGAFHGSKFHEIDEPSDTQMFLFPYVFDEYKYNQHLHQPSSQFHSAKKWP